MSVWDDQSLDDPVALKRVVLERLAVACQQSVDVQVLRDAQVDVRRDLADRLIVSLRSYVLAEQLASHTETASMRLPATWWDHWKLTHPRAARRWSRWVWQLAPPCMDTRTLTCTWDDRAVYPHTQLPPPDRRLGAVVFWRTAHSHLDHEDHHGSQTQGARPGV
jgi:hypothetical protein